MSLIEFRSRSCKRTLRSYSSPPIRYLLATIPRKASFTVLPMAPTVSPNRAAFSLSTFMRISGLVSLRLSSTSRNPGISLQASAMDSPTPFSTESSLPKIFTSTGDSLPAPIIISPRSIKVNSAPFTLGSLSRIASVISSDNLIRSSLSASLTMICASFTSAVPMPQARSILLVSVSPITSAAYWISG